MEEKREKIFLRRFTVDDIDDEYLSWLNDKNLMRFSNQRFKTHTISTCRDYINGMEKEGNLFYAINTNENIAKIGTITAYINKHHNTADIGILIGNKEVAGKGYGYRAWRQLIKLLIEIEGIRKVTSGTLSANRKMIRIIEKAGMKEEGRRRKQEIVDGKEEDMILYGLLAEEFS